MGCKYKVVPICERQKRDVNEKDILNGGLYRKCNVYKGGGGYDKFPYICKRRLGYQYSNQFVVQLYGCPLKCSYCYVTSDGIWGEYVEVDVRSLIGAFVNSGQDVFHLMGGAPALYLDKWVYLIRELNHDKIFHSDLLLIERPYTFNLLESISRNNTLYAVSIKGTKSKFVKNTGTVFNEELFWYNFNQVVRSRINFYITFTDMSDNCIDQFKDECRRKLSHYHESIFDDNFSIDLIHYAALD